MPRARILLMAFVVFGLTAGLMTAKAAKPSSLEELIATPQHLKGTLAPKTILATRLDSDPEGPKVAKVIAEAELGAVTQILPLPENAKLPLPITRPAPVFPGELRLNGFSGSASFLFLLGADGTVKSIYCYRSTHPQLAVAAAAALASWKFKPATIQRTPIPVLANQTFEFNATD